MDEPSPQGAAAWFRPLCVTAGLLQAVFVAVRVLITYRALELGGGAAAVGIITASYSLVPLAISVPAGRWVDGRMLSRALRVGAIVSVGAVVVCALSGSLPVLVVGSVLLGVGNLLTMVAAQAYIPRMSAPAQFDHRFGMFSLAVSIGQAGGLPVAGLIASSALGTAGAMGVMAGLCTLAGSIAAARSLSTGGRGQARDTAPERVGMVAMLGEPGFRAAVFGSLVVLTAIDLMSAYLPVLGEHRGWGVLAVTAVLTARSIASVASRAFLGPLLARVPRRALLVAGTGGSVLPVIALPWVPHVAVAAILMAVAGFFWGIAQPLSMTWVTQLVPPAVRGSALAMRMSGNRVGQVVIPLAAGGLASVTGVGAVFVATAGLLSAAAALTWRTTRSE